MVVSAAGTGIVSTFGGGGITGVAAFGAATTAGGGGMTGGSGTIGRARNSASTATSVALSRPRRRRHTPEVVMFGVAEWMRGSCGRPSLSRRAAAGAGLVVCAFGGTAVVPVAPITAGAVAAGATVGTGGGGGMIGGFPSAVASASASVPTGTLGANASAADGASLFGTRESTGAAFSGISSSPPSIASAASNSIIANWRSWAGVFDSSFKSTTNCMGGSVSKCANASGH
jgi:hypothetical protein